MRVLQLVIVCLAAKEILAKKNPGRGPSASRPSSTSFAPSTRKSKLSYEVDWESTEADNYEEDYFAGEEYRSGRSQRFDEELDDEEYSYKPKKRPQQKRKGRTTDEQAAARSEGTFSGAGKGPLYDAYNQLHTLAQVRLDFLDTFVKCLALQ